jgi:hypothetical protein
MLRRSTSLSRPGGRRLALARVALILSLRRSASDFLRTVRIRPLTRHCNVRRATRKVSMSRHILTEGLTLSERTERSGFVLILSSVSAPPSTCQSLSFVWKAAFGTRPCDGTGEFGASILDDLSAVITAGDASERRTKFFTSDCCRKHLQFLSFDVAAPAQNGRDEI